jgi:hypothetical protein
MSETNERDTDSNEGDNDDTELGGVLGGVGLEYDDETETDENEADDTPESDDPATEDETTGTDTEAGTGNSEPADDPFAPEPGMNLSESLGTKLTPPEKEFIEAYVEFSDEYAHSGEFLRAIVDELRQEYGEEVMRRKQALDELKGGL